jgi:MFS family permease
MATGGDITETSAVRRHHSLLSVLRYADYRKLWAAQLISVLGDKLYQIALAILVFEATGSMLQMGIMLAVTTAPAVLLGPFAGVLADRYERRMVMIIADLGRALLVLLVPLIAPYGLFPVYAIAFGLASVSLFFDPARLALIPEIVPDDVLLTANSMDQFGTSTAELLGLAAGGAVVALLEASSAFYVDAGTFILSAVLIWTIRATTRPVAAETGDAATGDAPLTPVAHLRRELVGGLRYIWRSPVLRTLTFIYSLAAFAGMGVITLVQVLALFTFEGGAATLAAFDIAITLGLLAGGVLVNRATLSHGLALAGGMVVFGVQALGLALSAAYVASGQVGPALLGTPWSLAYAVTLGLLLVGGIANTFFVVANITITQEHAEPALRGRVFALRFALVRVAGIVGLVGAGALAEVSSVATAYVVVAVPMVVAGVLAWSSRSLRSA